MTSQGAKLVGLANQALKIIASDGSFTSIMKTATITNFTDDGSRMKSELVISKEHLNPQGTFSGGAITTFIDFMTGLNYMGNRGDLVSFPVLSVQLEVKFMSPALEGDLVKCDSFVLKSGKRLVFMSAELYNATRNNKVVATGQHILSIDPNPKFNAKIQ